MKTILISGSSGFLGRETIGALLQNGFRVLALTSNPDGLSSKYPQFTGLQVFHKDDYSFVDSTPIDLFLNCAFSRSEKGSLIANGLDYQAELFSKLSSRIASAINISSQSVYLQHRKDLPDESTVVHPDSLYALGKFASELLFDAYFKDIPHTNLRLASLLCPEFDQRLVNALIRRVIGNQPITVRGGNQKYNYLDIRDAALALICISKSDPKCWKPLYNLGPTSQPLSLSQIVNSIVSTGKHFGFSPKCETIQSDADTDSTLNSELFSKDFQWKSKYTIEDTISNIYSAYLNQ